MKTYDASQLINSNVWKSETTATLNALNMM